MFDLYPCAQSSLTDLGHDSYALRQCSQCAGAFAYCVVCEAPELCPGCVHTERLAAIRRGEVVFPETACIDANTHPEEGPPVIRVIDANTHPEGTDQDAVSAMCGQAHDLDSGNIATAIFDHAGAAGELAHGSNENQVSFPNQGSDLDHSTTLGYNPATVGQSHTGADSPSNGAPHVDTPTFPFVLLLLPVTLEGLPSAVQAFSAMWTGTSATNGHLNGHDASVEGGQRLPRHLAKKCYLSDTPCPSGHSYRDTGKVLRYHGNNQCVPCSGQRKPTRTAASTAAHTEG